MGLIIEISPLLDIELRRESFRLIPQFDDGESTEMRYKLIYALEAAIKQIKESDRFKTWLRKHEGHDATP